tara:strand:+ start:8817 stop:9329 length:513 start_codon:yes stop_codon:yes gene_type:complete
MDYQDKKAIQKQTQSDCYNMLNVNDPRANYVCGTKGLDADIEEAGKTYTPLSKMDYYMGSSVGDLKNCDCVNSLEPEPEDGPVIEPDKRKTLSFLQVKSIEEGIEWYRRFDPKIPDELLPLLARWNWGDLSTITKKQVKNERKKDKRKGKKNKGLLTGMTIRKEPVVINF